MADNILAQARFWLSVAGESPRTRAGREMLDDLSIVLRAKDDAEADALLAKKYGYTLPSTTAPLTTEGKAAASKAIKSFRRDTRKAAASRRH